MARIAYKQAADAEGEVKVQIASIKANIIGIVCHAEGISSSVFGLLASMLTRLELDDRLRQLTVLLVANRTEAAYEWRQHVPLAEHVGVTAEQIACVEQGELDADCFDDKEKAVLAFAAEVLAVPRPCDSSFEALGAAGIETREAVEVVALVGAYQMMAHFMTAFDIDEEEPFPVASLDSTIDHWNRSAAG